MLNSDIIRSWKDEDYFSSLSKEQRSQLPENPAGMFEILSHDELGSVVGGGCWGYGRQDRDEYRIRNIASGTRTARCEQEGFDFF